MESLHQAKLQTFFEIFVCSLHSFLFQWLSLWLKLYHQLREQSCIYFFLAWEHVLIFFRALKTNAFSSPRKIHNIWWNSSILLSFRRWNQRWKVWFFFLPQQQWRCPTTKDQSLENRVLKDRDDFSVKRKGKKDRQIKIKAHIDINVETDEDADIDDINEKKIWRQTISVTNQFSRKVFFLIFNNNLPGSWSSQWNVE